MVVDRMDRNDRTPSGANAGDVQVKTKEALVHAVSRLGPSSADRLSQSDPQTEPSSQDPHNRRFRGP